MSDYVNVNRDALYRAMSIATRVAPRRTSMPILTNTLLQFEPGSVTLGATDMTLAYATRLDCRTENLDAPFGVTVDTFRLSSLIDSFKEPSVRLSHNGNEMLYIQCGRSRSRFRTMPGEEFPLLPLHLKGERTLEYRDLADIISHVTFSASDPRKGGAQVLEGVHMVTRDGELVCEAADGFRLSVYAVPWDGPEFDVIVPPELLEVAGHFRSEHYALQASEFNMVITGEDGVNGAVSTVRSSLLDGNYPDVRRIIPEDFAIAVTAPRDSLRAAAERCMIFASTSANILKLTLNKDAETDTHKLLVAANTDTGSNTSEVPVLITKGHEFPFTIAINGHFLIAALKAAKSEEVEMRFNSPVQPMSFSEAHTDRWLHVVMPMHVRD